MFIWFIKWFIFSFILIILLHYLYNFCIDKLTIPKVKDYIYIQDEKRKIIDDNKSINNTNNTNNIVLNKVALKNSLISNLNKQKNL